MRRVIAIVLIVAGVFVAIAAATAGTRHKETTTERVSKRIHEVVVNGGSGDVIVRVRDETTVKRTERWNFVRPRYEQHVEDGTLTVTATCRSSIFNNCGTDLVLGVPKDVTVRTKTTNGDIGVADVSGAVDARTTNGDLTLSGVSGSIDAHTTNGDLTLADVTSSTVDARTSNGDLHADLLSKPRNVEVGSTNGDVEVRLPKGSYDVDTDTTNGDVSTDGFTNDPSSKRKVSVSTTNGDIDVIAG